MPLDVPPKTPAVSHCDDVTLDVCATQGGVGPDGICPATGLVCKTHQVEPNPDDFGPDATADIERFAGEDRKSGAKGWKLHRRWDRAARLFTEPGMQRLDESYVVVFGLGGVGSYTAEGLARSGVGRLDLVDFDEVCATNVNRQMQALRGTFGKSKAELMAERCRMINPDGDIRGVKAFYYPKTSEELLAGHPDYVVDAIDNVSAKLHLIATCMKRGIPLVSSMGAAGKIDPTQVKIADLSETHSDPLARDVRKFLRRKYGVDTSKPTGVASVFSPEKRSGPFPPAYDGDGGFRCICPSRGNDFHSCDSRNQIDGTAGFVTSVFGMVAASAVVRGIIGDLPAQHAAG